MFPTRERIERVFSAIEPALMMAVSGTRGLFNSRKRNAMFLGVSLVEARQFKDQWKASGDYYHVKKAHNALCAGVRAAMKASGLDCTPENESTALIVYNLLEASIMTEEECPIADVGDTPAIAEILLRQMYDTAKQQDGLDLFERTA